MSDLSVTVRDENGCAVVEVAGDVDVYSAAVLRERLDRLIAAGVVVLVLDLEGVSFMDSTGLGVLVGRLRRVRLAGGAILLVCTVPRILRVFAITGLNQVFPVFGSVDEAIRAAGTATEAG